MLSNRRGISRVILALWSFKTSLWKRVLRYIDHFFTGGVTMQKKKRSQWRKLDNAAQAFPAATGKKDTRVFRLYCELKEDVIEEVLQKAVECTLEKYPLYCSVLRKGLFWFYMEQRNLKPKVKAEDRPPCSGLYVPDQKSFLFEVSYYKKENKSGSVSLSD